jgi:hypothetical protein
VLINPSNYAPLFTNRGSRAPRGGFFFMNKNGRGWSKNVAHCSNKLARILKAK